MSSKNSKKIDVQGLKIRIEPVHENDYISLTDIAKKFAEEGVKPNRIIQNWMRNKDTLEFLATWEKISNPKFKGIEFETLMSKAGYNRFAISPSAWVKKTDAIDIYTKPVRGGGTFAHKDIALGFCYWLSPPFQVFILKEFQRLKEQEFNQKNLEWHISKITDNIEEVRNLLDTIPFQKPERNRIKDIEE